MNRNSVRKSPTPSAPHERAYSASSAEPRFAETSMRRPSRVRASTCLYASRVPRSSAIASLLRPNSATASGSGSSTAYPSPPSTATVLDSNAASKAGPTPTTAGIPIERAMIETWEVLDPSAVTNPNAVPLGIRAVSEGARLRARMTEGTSRASSLAVLRPMSSATSWLAARHVAHVVGLSYHVLLVHLGEQRGVFLTDSQHGCLWAHKVPHALLDLRRELGVSGQLDVGIEDSRFLFSGRLTEPVTSLGELL